MIAIWLIIGLLSTILAIYRCRTDGTTIREGELYMAAIGPFLGPIITILLIIDWYRK